MEIDAIDFDHFTKRIFAIEELSNQCHTDHGDPRSHTIFLVCEKAADRGLRVIIAGAGGAAHLPGMVASLTPLPVIGVPIPLSHLDGLDSLLSIAQMPAGVPVATVAVGNARNAGLLAVRILGSSDAALLERMRAFQESLRETALEKGARVRGHG